MVCDKSEACCRIPAGLQTILRILVFFSLIYPPLSRQVNNFSCVSLSFIFVGKKLTTKHECFTRNDLLSKSRHWLSNFLHLPHPSENDNTAITVTVHIASSSRICKCWQKSLGMPNGEFHVHGHLGCHGRTNAAQLESQCVLNTWNSGLSTTTINQWVHIRTFWWTHVSAIANTQWTVLASNNIKQLQQRKVRTPMLRGRR